MEEDIFLATVAYFGEENILGFVFDNSARHLFTKNDRFSLAKNYIPSIQHLVFEVEDPKGTKVRVAKHIGHIQTIVIVKSESDWDTVNSRFIGF